MKYDLGTKHLEFILDAPLRSSEEETAVKKGSDLVLDFLEECWKSEL